MFLCLFQLTLHYTLYTQNFMVVNFRLYNQKLQSYSIKIYLILKYQWKQIKLDYHIICLLKSSNTRMSCFIQSWAIRICIIFFPCPLLRFSIRLFILVCILGDYSDFDVCFCWTAKVVVQLKFKENFQLTEKFWRRFYLWITVLSHWICHLKTEYEFYVR